MFLGNLPHSARTSQKVHARLLYLIRLPVFAPGIPTDFPSARGNYGDRLLTRRPCSDPQHIYLTRFTRSCQPVLAASDMA